MASKTKTARKSRKGNVIVVDNGTVVLHPSAPVVDLTPPANEAGTVGDVGNATARARLDATAPLGNEAAPAPAGYEVGLVDVDQALTQMDNIIAATDALGTEAPAPAPAVRYVAITEWDLPHDLRPGDPCVVTVGKGDDRRDRDAVMVSRQQDDGVVVVQVDPAGLADDDDGIRQVSARVVRPAPVALTLPEREILAELWFASETEGHDYGAVADLLGIEEGDRVSRCRVLEAKGLITCDDRYEQFTFTGRGRALFASFNDSPDLKEQCIMGSKNRRTDQRGNMVEVEHEAGAATGPAPASAAATKTAPATRKRGKPPARPVEDQAPPQEQPQEEAPLERPTAPRKGKPAPAAAAPAKGKPAAPAKPAKVAKPAEPAEGKVFDVEDIKRRAAAGEELARGEKAALAGQQGFERDSDVPWNDKKVLIISTLQELGATSAGKAQSSSAVAEAAGVSGRDVRHYCYHARAGGWVDFCKVEGTPGYSFFLTAKGAKCDPAKEQAKEQAAKGKPAKAE